MDTSSNASESTMGSTGGKTVNRLKSLRVKTKDKLQKLKARTVHRGDNIAAEPHEALGELNEDPAFNPDKVQETLTEHHDTLRSKVDKTGSKIEHVAGAIFHPQQSARAKAARETAKTLGAAPESKPTARDERDLVDAEDDLTWARKETTVDDVLRRDDELGANAEKYLERVMELEEHRDKMKAGYAMSHVNRAKVVNTNKFPWPHWQNFMHKVDVSGKQWFDWKGYLASLFLYEYQGIGAQYIEDPEEHPFEADVLRSHIERLAMVTATWQAWAMDIRSVYRWDNPTRTTRWLLIYLVLWYMQYFIAYAVGWIIWSTIRNKFIRASANDIRESMKRAADNESTAWHLGELLDKHDSSNWLDELGKTVGPGVQQDLGDLADLFEVLANFREWKSPKHTGAALVLMAVHLVICFTSWDFSTRYIYGVVGLMFFVSWPIQSVHRRYRYAASLTNIVLFEIPTNAQWAFAYLRRQALLGQLNVIDHERRKDDSVDRSVSETSSSAVDCADFADGVPTQEQGLEATHMSEQGEYPIESTSLTTDDGSSPGTASQIIEELGSTPLISFHADWDGKHGRLVITASGLHFQRPSSRRIIWVLPFDRLNEIQKLDSIKKMQSKLRALTKSKAVSSGDRLLLQEVDGKERTVQLPKDRDQCFNCIIGFSGLQWQRLQGGAAKFTKP